MDHRYDRYCNQPLPMRLQRIPLFFAVCIGLFAEEGGSKKVSPQGADEGSDVMLSVQLKASKDSYVYDELIAIEVEVKNVGKKELRHSNQQSLNQDFDIKAFNITDGSLCSLTAFGAVQQSNSGFGNGRNPLVILKPGESITFKFRNVGHTVDITRMGKYRFEVTTKKWICYTDDSSNASAPDVTGFVEFKVLPSPE
jgi:hypothetical protein